jgi:HNH endonuclease
MMWPTPFAYPTTPHSRRHAPAGYKDYRDYKPWLRDEFEFRCVYCLQREMWSRDRDAVFSVDHVVPQFEDPDGQLTCNYANLVYACTRCNSARREVRVLDPTAVNMADHVRIEADGTTVALSEGGGLLIELLHLNAAAAIGERRRIARILARAVEAPDDQRAQLDFREALGFPEELPDLRTLRPPEGNRLAANAERCFFALRASGLLPETY